MAALWWQGDIAYSRQGKGMEIFQFAWYQSQIRAASSLVRTMAGVRLLAQRNAMPSLHRFIFLHITE